MNIHGMKLWILLALLPLVASESECEIKYFEDVIKKGIQAALNYQLPNNASQYRVEDEYHYNNYDTYDFIIIGGGVGGLVLANRLSEMEQYKVLVLEAGDWENAFSDIPGMSAYARNSKYNWNFKTTLQDHGCLGMEGKQCSYPMGKAFGGTTLYNALYYVRGNKADFDKWEEDGNTGWCFDKILKYFKRSEKTTIPDLDKEYHGFDGPLQIEYYDPLGVHTSAFLNASKEMGYKQVDFNGALMTPQILMLSGIGPKKHLQDLHIDTIVDLPVGKNLHDHPAFSGLNIYSNYTQQTKTLTDQIVEYLDGKGSLAISGNYQGLGHYQSKLAKIEGQPDIQLLVVPPNRTSPLTQKVLGYSNVTIESLNKNITNQSTTFTINVVCLQPKSFGVVKLRSSDPYDYPVIDPKIFSNSHDKKVLLEAVRFIQCMLKTKAFRKVGAKIGLVDHPDCRKYKPNSDNYWYCQIGLYSFNLYHPMGTAKIAPKKKGGVTDPTLRVYGIKNLRIGDGSVIPWPLSGHPVAAITMIAEKLSDMIKKDYNNV